MKISQKLPRISTFFIVAILLNLGVSCKNQNEIENDESFGGSSKRQDICELLSISDIKAVFEISETTELQQKNSNDVICTYVWEDDGEEMFYYQVGLNFAKDGVHTATEIEAMWESQNNGVYSKWGVQNVSGVGDKASWSDLGGGQLRVASKGFIFYLSLNGTPMKNNPMSKQEMIDKASLLAKCVINKI